MVFKFSKESWTVIITHVAVATTVGASAITGEIEERIPITIHDDTMLTDTSSSNGSTNNSNRNNNNNNNNGEKKKRKKRAVANAGYTSSATRTDSAVATMRRVGVGSRADVHNVHAARTVNTQKEQSDPINLSNICMLDPLECGLFSSSAITASNISAANANRKSSSSSGNTQHDDFVGVASRELKVDAGLLNMDGAIRTSRRERRLLSQHTSRGGRAIKAATSTATQTDGAKLTKQQAVACFTGTSEQVIQACADANANCCCSGCEPDAFASADLPTCLWESDAVTVCANSCNDGPGACVFYSTTGHSVGGNSCNGPYSCYDSYTSIGHNSCQGNRACYFMDDAFVSNNACNGDDACSYKKDSVGASSCNGARACESNSGFISRFSCVGIEACQYNEQSVGRNQCVGDYICDALP